MAGLLPTLEKMAALQADAERLLPGVFTPCRVLQLREGQMHIAVPNAALATRIRQILPKLQAGLREKSWPVDAIRIKVQMMSGEDRVPNRPAAQAATNPCGAGLRRTGAITGSRPAARRAAIAGEAAALKKWLNWAELVIGGWELVQGALQQADAVFFPKTRDPGLRRDDGGNFTVAPTTTVFPSQTGIQCLSSRISRI